MLANSFGVNHPTVKQTPEDITVDYEYQTTRVLSKEDGSVTVEPIVEKYQFHTDCKIPRTGAMIVGLGGNNGTTVTCGILANKKHLEWETKRGTQKANYYGSLTQCTTSYLGDDQNHKQVFIPFHDLLPMVCPNDLVIGGWDISSANMYEAARRARVLEPTLLCQLKEDLEKMTPYPAAFDINFVAPNQKERANNVIPGSKQEQMETIRKQIREFKEKNGLDKVIVLWSANTERYTEWKDGVHDTAEHLLAAIKNGESEIAPSMLYACAAIMEGCNYINGSPQNTLCKGIVELATQHHVYIMGDDFKTGQTKFKSSVADFLINSGLKLTACTSYNHLGNNDGLNLSYEKCFRSKEISKSSVIDDIVDGNRLLYEEGEHPDHIIVIKYVPSVGDSKRALDEYDSEIFLGGQNIISVHNTCEDSLLAAPLMIDLVLLMELFSRVEIKAPGMDSFGHMHCILSAISFLLKAPRTPPGTPVINALAHQRACLENILRACRGLPPISHMHLEYKLPQ